MIIRLRGSYNFPPFLNPMSPSDSFCRSAMHFILPFDGRVLSMQLEMGVLFVGVKIFGYPFGFRRFMRLKESLYN